MNTHSAGSPIHASTQAAALTTWRAAGVGPTSGLPASALFSVAAWPSGNAWDQTSNEIDATAALADNWDGEGAAAPTDSVVATVKLLCSTLARLEWPAPTRVSASPTGGIILEWQDGMEYVEFEIAEANVAELFLTRPGQPDHVRRVSAPGQHEGRHGNERRHPIAHLIVVVHVPGQLGDHQLVHGVGGVYCHRLSPSRSAPAVRRYSS